jgi:hypothetical protein
MPNNSAQFLVDLTVLHTTEQLRGGARDFCAVLDQAPSAFVWESNFSHAFAENSVPADSLQALRNATIESSLLSIRILNDFFAQRRFSTDIRAGEYQGYTSPGEFLSSQEVRDLNKYLAHLTTERAEHSPKQWQLYDFIRRTHHACSTFVRFLSSPEGAQYRPDNLDTQSRIQTCERIELLLRLFCESDRSNCRFEFHKSG